MKESLSMVEKTKLGVATLLFTGSAALAGCSGDSDAERNNPGINIDESDTAQSCDVPATAPASYLERVGTGPYETNDAFDQETVNKESVVTELAQELPGNVMGISLLSEAFKLQDGDYKVADFKNSAETTFTNLSGDEEATQEACAVVVDTLYAKGELVELKTSEVARFTNRYEGDALVGLNNERAKAQDTISVLTVRDANGAARFGVVVDQARDGEFVLIVDDQKKDKSNKEDKKDNKADKPDQEQNDGSSSVGPNEAENPAGTNEEQEGCGGSGCGGGSGSNNGNGGGSNGGNGGGGSGGCGNCGGGGGGGGGDTPSNPGTPSTPNTPTTPNVPSNPPTPNNPPTNPPTTPPTNPPTTPPSEPPKGPDPGCPPGAPCE